MIILGVICIIGGIITANRKTNEKVIRIENKIRGVKSEITSTTLNIQQSFGIFISILGAILVIWGIFIK